MSFRIEMDAPVNDEIRRIAREQLEGALQALHDDTIDTHETIHQVRKRCKKLRGLIRLARPSFESTYQQENARLRDAAARLSSARDAQAVLETFDKLAESLDEKTPAACFAWIRLRLLEARDQVERQGEDLPQQLEAFGRDMRELRERSACWPLADHGFATIAGGLRKTYARGRKAMDKAAHDPTTERFHEWRKRVKYHRYHLRLLRKIWERPMKARRKELHDLSDLLGFEHDLAVLAGRLTDDPERFPDNEDLAGFLGLIEQRRGELRQRAFNLGRRLYSEKPKRLKKRLKGYWDAAREAK